MLNKFSMILHRSKDKDYTYLFKKDLFGQFIKANPDFTMGNICFNTWNLKDYQMNFPDKLKQIIDSDYKNTDGDYYWCGDYYESYESLLEDLSTQKILFELEVRT